MKRRASIVAMLVVGLLAATGRTAPAYVRVVSSAHQFQRYFRDLKKADTMSPIERFVFSLVLANSEAPRAETPKVAGKEVAGKEVTGKNIPGKDAMPFGRT